jgi:hypothetical protein
VSVGITHGRDVRVRFPADADIRLVHGPLLGPVLGAVLLQRRILCLHASVVDTPRGAIAIAGAAGAGKSTTAASLYLGGARLLADDIAALRFDGAVARVRPGYPLIKLWPEAVDLLGITRKSTYLVEPATGKRGLIAQNGFRWQDRRLRCVLVLEPGSGRPEALLRPADRVKVLLQQSYGLTALRLSGGLAGQFSKLARLAKMTRVVRVPMGSRDSPRSLVDRVLAAAASADR